MTLISLIADYGYVAVFFGTCLEGETVLLLAGFAAHRGLLRLADVMAIAFVASTLGDQCFYWIGRRFGEPLFARFPALGRQVLRIRNLLDRYHAPLILSIRFLYGLRMAGPMAMGALRVPAMRFAVLNMAGAALWAVLVAWLGYQFGNLLELFVQDLKRVEESVLVAILLGGCAWWLARRIRSRSGRV